MSRRNRPAVPRRLLRAAVALCAATALATPLLATSALAHERHDRHDRHDHPGPQRELTADPARADPESGGPPGHSGSGNRPSTER